jgi:hypothetical protein
MRLSCKNRSTETLRRTRNRSTRRQKKRLI